MVYKPGKLRRKGKEIVNARNWSIGIITALLGLGFFISEIQRIKALNNDPMNWGYLALFILTGILVFLWIWASQKELDLLFDWLDPERYVPPSSLKETIMILWCGAILTALLFSSRDPYMYGIMFFLYSLLIIPSVKYLNEQIRTAIDKSKARSADDLNDPNQSMKAKLYMEGVDVLHEYFLERPMLKRLIIIAVASAIGLIAGIYWKLSGQKIIGILSYGILFLTIFLSEIVIARWRCIRDDKLRKIEAELDEYIRDD
ncbi:MAG: hypothetical protein JW774_04335 [Candidatus Aureabacteria bacterium]|nr:hypothetical protein [Candidatus Auribacterota bacterium]